MSERITKKKQADLTREQTLEWGREHWTLLRCDGGLRKLTIVNGSDYHWIETPTGLNRALDRIGDYLIEAAEDAAVLAHEAQKAKTPADRLRIDGYLDALRDAIRVLSKSHDEIRQAVRTVFLNPESAVTEPTIVIPERVTHPGLRTQLPVPTFTRGDVSWGGGMFTSSTVFPSHPYTTPATENTRRRDRENREAARA